MPIVRVVDYDPGWPGRAADAIGELERVLPGVLTEIEHIGSTADRLLFVRCSQGGG